MVRLPLFAAWVGLALETMGCASPGGSDQSSSAGGDLDAETSHGDSSVLDIDASNEQGTLDASSPGLLANLGDAMDLDALANDGFGCSSAATNYVYVLSDSNALYRFAPNTKTFEQIGAIDCDAAGIPNSMAVDRQATAWVNYSVDDYANGTLRQVSTGDAACAVESYGLPDYWTQIGMAYLGVSADASSEGLYVTTASTYATASLAQFEPTPSPGSFAEIGKYSGALYGLAAELTGTGDGRLYGLFDSNPVQLVQLDPSSAATVASSTLPLANLGTSFAFSFWGGYLYLYVYPYQGSSSTVVMQYDLEAGTLDTSYMANVGFVITGAGESTCVPVQRVLYVP